MEVKRRADADEHGCLKRRAQPRHPLLLLGHADAGPHHVGPRMVDLLRDRGLLLKGQRAMGWGVSTDDLDPRVAAAEVECELDQGALVTTTGEIEAVTLFNGPLAGPRRQLGTV